jgi:diaminohydroxyphosphoribosylaminopyrimidine deaminase / 5-amino-6-(5-phosphoribosylamino)uracil reductase
VMKNHEYYMGLALKLAQKGRGFVSPNPLVGALIVKNGQIIGRGYHKLYSGDHAEVNAIRDAGQHVAGTTLYVTLEPCCHQGKTPPCVNSIIEHRIKQVVIGITDSNPLVSCQGINYLRSRGIEVITGILENECRKLNEVFFHYMETGRPFITLKYAQTLDGRIATVTGQSQWISSPAALKFAHKLRAEHDAILIGSGTVRKDDPELTVRHVSGRNPLRVIIDKKLETPLKAKVLTGLNHAKTLIVTTMKADNHKFRLLQKSGAEVISVIADKSGNVDLKKLLPILAQRKISSILVEGGAKIITSFLKDNLANRLVTIIAPKILGEGISAAGDLHITSLDSAKILAIQKIKKSGPDIIIDSRLT